MRRHRGRGGNRWTDTDMQWGRAGVGSTPEMFPSLGEKEKKKTREMDWEGQVAHVSFLLGFLLS